MLRLHHALLALVCAVSCTGAPEPGVSRSLAERRGTEYGDVSYTLRFAIPASRSEAVEAEESVTLDLARRQDIVLDWREDASLIHSVTIGGAPAGADISNEHIVIPRKMARKGPNTIDIVFTAGEQSLNRKDEYLYTLLVPDRARTLFPCFDQPDLKATYKLSLDVPDGWLAVSNTAAVSGTEFAPTEPLSTYLFSFVAGKFTKVTEERDGRTVSLYHRETDPARTAQCGEVLDLVYDSMEYMEEYTGVPYPFAKYDLIVLPDFQYGGMEHTGATLYNDRRIFLGEKPTTDELLGRASLIAHETAHMWFGDYVTMKWFDDVWTKEVFANWFAAQMARPQFPGVNHHLGDLRSYYAPAYAEDRTPGSNAIRRPLDNLSHAGLIYGNIIYDKAPVVLDMLAERMGAEGFRRGLQRYLQEYGYSNADWDDLIAALSPEAGFDIEGWSRVWITEPGMPQYRAEYIGGEKLAVKQTDPFGHGNVWPQSVRYRIVNDKGLEMDLTAGFNSSDEFRIFVEREPVYCLPNIDGRAYGYFEIDDDDASYIYGHIGGYEEDSRMSLLMTLYDNVWRSKISAEDFVGWAAGALRTETNPLILSSLVSYAGSAISLPDGAGAADRLADALRSTAADPAQDHELRLTAFRQLYAIERGSHTDELYGIWAGCSPYPGLTLGESDYTSMAYQLMVRMPDKASEIRAVQAERISNPDRRESFEYVSRAAAADAAERDAFFESLLDPQGRRVEARVRTALALLNHPLRQQEAVRYIRPALEALQDVQRTGDIFFPANWCSSLLGGHVSREAYDEVRAFLDDHPDYDPLLLTKILQSAGLLIQLYGN